MSCNGSVRSIMASMPDVDFVYELDDAPSAPLDRFDDANVSTESDDARELSQRDKEFVLVLISLYKDCPDLWDIKRKSYMNKKMRFIALNKITDHLKQIDKDFTVEKLKRKINTLRSNFRREYTKVKKSLTSGTSEDEVYYPKLWYYNELLFIVDPSEIAKTEGLMQKTAAEIAANPTNKTRKKKKPSKNDDILETPESDTDIIAKSWAVKLNRLDPDQRCFAEKIINDVLFEGEMGTLTRDGVTFL